MTAEQDRTPGPAGSALYDLMGNAQEWTLDLYRSDGDGSVEAWVQAEGRAFRAIRGLPLTADPPRRLPREGAASRNALCASGACPEGVDRARRSVGFRCARPLTGGP
jgi:formylglycine-generating enzyme required for sulfatase activity